MKFEHIKRKQLAVALLAAVLSMTCACSSTPDSKDAGGMSIDAIDDSTSDPSGLKIVRVSPASGQMQALQEVDIEAIGLFEDAEVFFGEQQAEVTYRAGGTHIFVMPPPVDTPGQVDVRVRNPGVASVVLKRGFTYLTEVLVDSFDPSEASARGGDLITVHGVGFRPGDRVVIDHRLALDSQVIDDATIVARVPAVDTEGKARTKVTVAIRHASGISYAAASLTVGEPPRIDHIVPAVVPPQGADVILKGFALNNAQRLYIGGASADLVDGTASSSRGAKINASLSGLGAVDALITGPFGHTLLSPAIAFADGSQSKLFAVSPAEGSTAGGQQVRFLADLGGAIATGAQFGEVSASVKMTEGSVVATLPPNQAGSVDVKLKTSKGDLLLKQGFVYREPLSVDDISPALGPVAGGQPIVVTGTGLHEQCELYMGPWRALDINVEAGVLSAKTPPGVAGVTHVRVRCGAASVLVADGYEYRPGKPEIHAISPRKGATGGGTLVAIHGAGFTEDTKIYFDGLQGQQTQYVNGALIRTKTPAHSPGAVNVEVTSNAGSDVLLNSFEYFSPTNPQGGTYGEGLQGTLNVTVLDIYSLKPLAGAFVQVGQPDDPDYPKYGGVTDESGQVVFSGTDLTPPVTVSAAKKEYSTSSIVNFEVGNATLLLFPWVPPSPGPGQPGPGLPLATVKGRVLDVDKYLLRPPTTCTKPSTGGPQCDFCEQDSDCSAAAEAGAKQWACVVTGGTAKRCFSVCKVDSDCDTNKDFVCLQDVFDDTRKVCQPSVGIREITCQSSTRGLDTLNPDPGPGAQVDETTGEYAITVRLDELAVYCVGGYRRKGVFRPTAMGVRRHIFPQPGQTIEGIDIKLNIPLVRKLPIRLDNPEPFHPANNGGDLEVKGWIHLGSDGYIPVAKRQSLAAESDSGTAVVNDLELSAQPLTLPEELTDSTYTWRAVVDYGHLTTPVPMEAGTFHANVVKPGDANLWIRQQGKWQTGQIGLSTTLAAALPGQATDVLYVGADGRVFRGDVDDAYTVWLPSLPDPYAEAPTVLAASGTPTNATMVGVDGLIRRLTISAAEVVTVVEESGALSSDLYGVCQVAEGRVAVGAAGALQIDVGGGWTALSSGTQSDLRAVACDSSGAVAVGESGTVIRIDWSNPIPQLSSVSAKLLRDVQFASDGQVWIAGQSTAGYGVLLRSVAGGTWKSAWPAGTKPSAVPALCSLTESSAGVWVLATDQGGLWRLTPSGLSDQSPLRRDVAPKDLATRSDGSVIVVGVPVLWLGPFLTVADLSAPKDVVSADAVQIEWAYAAGPDATITRVHLNGMGFPFWWLYVNPTTTSVNLPDFTALNALTTLPTLQTPYSARVDRIFAPELSINAFATYDVEGGDWRSWSTNGKLFSVQP